MPERDSARERRDAQPRLPQGNGWWCLFGASRKISWKPPLVNNQAHTLQPSKNYLTFSDWFLTGFNRVGNDAIAYQDRHANFLLSFWSSSLFCINFMFESLIVWLIFLSGLLRQRLTLSANPGIWNIQFKQKIKLKPIYAATIWNLCKNNIKIMFCLDFNFPPIYGWININAPRATICTERVFCISKTTR